MSSELLDKLNAINTSGCEPQDRMDKKIDLIIYQLVGMEDHETRIGSLEDGVKIVKANMGLIKWVAGLISAAFVGVTTWISTKH